MIKLSKKVDLYIRNIIFLFFTLIPATIYKPNQDLLEGFRFISPDGLDWIVEGRILGSENLTLPVLRNIGYVLASKLDWVLGGHGLVFALTNILGLFLQGLSLILMMNHFQIKHKYQSVGLIIYFGSWIHFSSIYILPDSIAVGCLIFGTTLMTLNRFENISKTLGGLIVITIGSLFQFYALAGFVFSFLITVNRKIPKKVIFIKITSTFGFMILSFSAILIWRRFVPHEVVPEPFDLLSVNFNMLRFYIEVWIIAFALIFLLFIGFANKNLAKPAIMSAELRFFSSFGAMFLLLALCYQWPDSRISYSGVAFSLICLITVFLKSIQYRSDSKSFLLEKQQLRAITLVVIVFSFIMPPKDYWSPKVFENRPLHTWSLIAIREYLRQTPSSYNGISIEIKKSCTDDRYKAFVVNGLEESNFSPYEKNILGAYLKYMKCL